MSQKNLIHIKLEYTEALGSKKDVLSSEINLLQFLKALKNYKELRMQELTKKQQILQKLKLTRMNLDKLKKSLPNPRIPKIIQHQQITETGTPKKKIYDNSLESQLQQIQDKLKALEQ